MPTPKCPDCGRKATSSPGQVAVSRYCPECRGNGYITCTRCGGEGLHFDRHENEIKDCDRCGLQGKVVHQECQGTGFLWDYVDCTAASHRRR